MPAVAAAIVVAVPAFAGGICLFPVLSPLSPTVGSPSDDYAGSVAYRDGIAAIGAPLVDGSTIDEGAVQVFKRAGQERHEWFDLGWIVDPNALVQAQFGSAVAVIDATHLAIGAPQDSKTLPLAGTVFIFALQGDVWSIEQTLASPNPTPAGQFGVQVASHDDLLAVTEGGYSPFPYYDARVHVYRRVEGKWAHEATLQPADGVVNARFGKAIDVDGETVVAGAPFDDEAAFRAGAVYVFTKADGRWSQSAKIPSPMVDPHAEFGRGVDLHGSDLFVAGDVAQRLQRTDTGWKAIAVARTLDGETIGGEDVALAENGALVIADRYDVWRCTTVGGTLLAEGQVTTVAPLEVVDVGRIAVDGDHLLVAYPAASDGSWPNIAQPHVGAVAPPQDCDGDGIFDPCALETGQAGDGDGDGVPNGCEDCDGNGVADVKDIAAGVQVDCDGDGEPDSCTLARDPSLDCDGNGVLDACQTDCNLDGVADICQILAHPTLDCDGDGVLDACAATYAADDGHADVAWGGPGVGESLSLMAFTVHAGAETIGAVSVCWVGWEDAGNPWVDPGTAVSLALFDDPDNDGVPHDAVVIASVDTTVAELGPNEFQMVTMPSTFVGAAGDRFFVGMFITIIPTPGTPKYPVVTDTDAPATEGSWIQQWTTTGGHGFGDVDELIPLTYDGPVAIMVRAVGTDGIWPPFPADLDCDGVIGGGDLGVLLAAWGRCPEGAACAADLTGDGVVDGADLGVVLALWGT